MVDPVTAGAAVLSGIKLVKQSVDFIKSNISTAQDVGDIIGHVDKALNGQQQVIKDRDSKNLDHFATENVAMEIINARLAQEELYTVSQLIDHRFGHGTWKYILAERKKRIDKHKQAVKEAKAKKLKKQKEMYDMIKFVLAHPHPIEGDETSCKLYEPKYFLICMSEGRGYADTELYLDYQMEKDNWIIESD